MSKHLFLIHPIEFMVVVAAVNFIDEIDRKNAIIIDRPIDFNKRNTRDPIWVKPTNMIYFTWRRRRKDQTRKKVLFKLNVANFIQIYRHVNEWKRKRNLFKWAHTFFSLEQQKTVQAKLLIAC